MKKLFLFLLSNVFISSSALAAIVPNKCPDPKIIKQYKFQFAEPMQNYTYRTSMIKNNFQTNSDWLFVFEGVPAYSISEALNKANVALGSVVGNPKPVFNNGRYICLYQNRFNYTAAAITFN